MDTTRQTGPMATGVVAAALAVGLACNHPGSGTEQPDASNQSNLQQTQAVQPADGPTMMLYYSGKGPRRGIGLATSSDGVKFTRSAANPVLTAGAPGSFDEMGVTDPAIVLHEGTFHLYYSGKSAAGLEQIGLATSQDGVTFERHSRTPVIAADPDGPDAARASDPTVFVDEGRFICLYSSQPAGGAEVTSLATSPDGIHWTKHGRNPVITSGHDPSLTYARIGGSADRWGVYYGAPEGVRLSFTDDLETFVDHPTAVLEPTPGGFDSAFLADVEIVPPAVGPAGRFHLYFGAAPRGGGRRIGLARSDDGLVFEKHPVPILIANSEEWEGGNISDPTVVVVAP